MLLQFTPSAVVPGGQSKSPVNLPSSMTLTSTGSPRFPAPQVITLTTKTPTPNTIITKPVTIRSGDQKTTQQMPRVLPQSDLQTMVAKPGEQVKLAGGQTQISFQVPVNWNAQGAGKSLLDTSKVSLVSFNSNVPNARSLLQTTVSADTTSNPAGIDQTLGAPKVTFVTTTTAGQKTFITGNKIIGNLAASCQVITQSPTGVISVARPPQAVNMTNTIPQRAINKANSFLISNKQYTIVPSSSNQVVTQIMKADAKNKGNVTMAAAQIMLPSGSFKRSWTQAGSQDGKQILITTSPAIKQGTVVTQGKTILTHKVPTSDSSMKVSSSSGVSSLMHTAKVVEVTSPSKGPGKTNILPAQKNWELVKQASALLPQKQKVGLSATQETGKENSSKTNENSEMIAGSGKEPAKNKEKVSVSEKSDIKTDNAANNGGSAKKNNPESKENETPKDVKKETKSKDILENKTDTNGDKDSKKEDADSVETQMETDDADQDGSRNKSDTNDGDAEKDDFNPVDAMTWKDGIGELPGSKLKVSVTDVLCLAS